MDLPEKDPLRRQNVALIGVVLSNLFAFVTIALTHWALEHFKGAEGVLVMAEFFIIPLVMGMICAKTWRTRIGIGGYFLWSFINFLFTLLWAWLFLGEGYICLIIVSPIIYLSLVAGSFIGRALFKRNNRTLNASVFGLILFLYVFDVFSSHDYRAAVRDELVINAPPEVVWPHVVAFDPIQDEPEF